MKRVGLCALFLVSGCSFLIPLDEFLEDGTGGGGGPTNASSSGGAPGVGGGGGGGGSPLGCTPERETDPNNCGEEGYECEDGICSACMCQPHSMGDFVVGDLLYDFGFGQKIDGTKVVVAALIVPPAALDVLTVMPDSWGISGDFTLPGDVSERIIAEEGRYFFSSDGIYYRGFDLEPGAPSTLVCRPDGTVIGTFDHLGRGGSHIYRSVYGDGAIAVGRIDQCVTDINMFAPKTFSDVTTAFAWEVVAGPAVVHWSNRTVGGGVHRIGSSSFGMAPPETLYTAPDGVPTALALVDGQLFIGDCLRGEIAVVAPGGSSATFAFPTVGHVAFFEAIEESDNTVTVYAIETGDGTLCAKPAPDIHDGSLVRYRGGVPRVLATGINLPAAVHVHDGHVYWSQHPMGGGVPQVMRLPL